MSRSSASPVPSREYDSPPAHVAQPPTDSKSYLTTLHNCQPLLSVLEPCSPARPIAMNVAVQAPQHVPPRLTQDGRSRHERNGSEVDDARRAHRDAFRGALVQRAAQQLVALLRRSASVSEE
jgi:hypothetical protein